MSCTFKRRPSFVFIQTCIQLCASARECGRAELFAMELGKDMSGEDTNLMLPQLAGDELLVEGVKTEKKRFR